MSEVVQHLQWGRVGSAVSGCAAAAPRGSPAMQRAPAHGSRSQALPSPCRLAAPMEHMLGAGSQLEEMMRLLWISMNPSAVVPSLIKFVEPQAIHGEKKCFPSVIRGKFGCQGARTLIMKLSFLSVFYCGFLKNIFHKVMMCAALSELVNGTSSLHFQGLARR